MADVKITDLPLGEEMIDQDELLYIDVSDTTAGPDGTDKRIKIGKLRNIANRQITTDFMINNTIIANNGDVVESQGFYVKGDGGGGKWVKTGDNDTPSQTPADMGDAKFTDAVGNVWELAYNGYVTLTKALDVPQSVAKTIMNSNGLNYVYPESLRVSNDPAVPDATNKVYVRELVDSSGGGATTVQIQRQVNTETAENPKALRVTTNIAEGVDSVEWSVSAELENNSDAVNGGATALSGVSLKNGKGNTFAGHFQVKDTTGLVSSEGGAMIGQELNIQANGEDDNEVRIGYDIIARTYAPLYDDFGSGDFYAGVRIRNSSQGVEGGRWMHALKIEDGTQSIPNAITIENSPGAMAGYSIRDIGVKARGFDMRGQYGVAGIDFRNSILTSSDIAIRLKDKAKIEFVDGVSVKWESGLSTPTLQFNGLPTESTATAGAGGALPASPEGYLKISLNGSIVSIPYFSTT